MEKKEKSSRTPIVTPKRVAFLFFAAALYGLLAISAFAQPSDSTITPGRAVATIDTASDRKDAGNFEPSANYLDDHMHGDFVTQIYMPRAEKNKGKFDTIKALREERSRRQSTAPILMDAQKAGSEQKGQTPSGVAPAPGLPNAPSINTINPPKPETKY